GANWRRCISVSRREPCMKTKLRDLDKEPETHGSNDSYPHEGGDNGRVRSEVVNDRIHICSSGQESCHEYPDQQYQGSYMRPDEVGERDLVSLAIPPLRNQKERRHQHDFKEKVELDQVCSENRPYHSQRVEHVQTVVEPVAPRIVTNPLTHVRHGEKRDQCHQQ